MFSRSLLTLAIEAEKCTQKELAKKLDVSPSLITRLKNGDPVDPRLEQKLREMAGIGDRDPCVVVQAGGVEQADKWTALISYLAARAEEGNESGYLAAPLVDEVDSILIPTTFKALEELGVELPKEFPAELDVDYQDYEDEGGHDALYRNLYARLILQTFAALTGLYGFYAAYIADHVHNEELDLFESPAGNIEPCLLFLAFSKTAEDSPLPSRFNAFSGRVMSDYTRWINVVKETAVRYGVPLKTELMAMVFEEPGMLGHMAEAEALKVNDYSLHPDVYMNELLENQRATLELLSAICGKLGITEADLRTEA